MKVKARLVGSLFGENDGIPGAFKFRTEPGGALGMHFWCPCGCGQMLGVSFAPGRWTWNGDRDNPTVRPSILEAGGGCGYHGFLTDGVFESC